MKGISHLLHPGYGLVLYNKKWYAVHSKFDRVENNVHVSNVECLLFNLSQHPEIHSDLNMIHPKRIIVNCDQSSVDNKWLNGLSEYIKCCTEVENIELNGIYVESKKMIINKLKNFHLKLIIRHKLDSLLDLEDSKFISIDISNVTLEKETKKTNVAKKLIFTNCKNLGNSVLSQLIIENNRLFDLLSIAEDNNQIDDILKKPPPEEMQDLFFNNKQYKNYFKIEQLFQYCKEIHLDNHSFSEEEQSLLLKNVTFTYGKQLNKVSINPLSFPNIFVFGYDWPKNVRFGGLSASNATELIRFKPNNVNLVLKLKQGEYINDESILQLATHKKIFLMY